MLESDLANKFMNRQHLANHSDEQGRLLTSRRRFLKQLGCGSLLALAGPQLASAALRGGGYEPSHKLIALENTNTGEKLKVAFFERGHYVDDALAEISYLFRDFHTGDVHPIDPFLLDQLHEIQQSLGIVKPFEVISGYRSPYTNAHLRKQSHRVAKHSLHMEGRAIDIRVAGVESRYIRDVAVAMQRGGVGYYPYANFVHLDTGDIRTW